MIEHPNNKLICIIPINTMYLILIYLTYQRIKYLSICFEKNYCWKAKSTVVYYRMEALGKYRVRYVCPCYRAAALNRHAELCRRRMPILFGERVADYVD
jgi:hypothetical protein